MESKFSLDDYIADHDGEQIDSGLSEPIQINVGEGLDIEGIKDALEADEGCLLFVVAARDAYAAGGSRAQVDTAEVTSINLFTNSEGQVIVTVNFGYTWSAHYGCRDMNTGDDDDGMFEAVYENGMLKIEGIPVRSTVDEF